MIQGFNPGLIGNPASISPFSSHKVSSRSAGPVIGYEYKELKPKKQMKEIRKVLLPEKKRFLFIRFGFKFNLRHRCVVCGSQQEWELSDPMRPPLPLSNVNKGRPLQGTYCPKHSGFFKQMEMLEQQILAEQHGLEFRSFIPKPKIPSLRRGPLSSLNQSDITSLIAMGWVVQPPQGTKESPLEQYSRLMVEIQGKLSQAQKIIPMIEGENNGE